MVLCVVLVRLLLLVLLLLVWVLLLLCDDVGVIGVGVGGVVL